MALENTLVYTKQGGAEEVIASGGLISVQSGGAINVETGGLLKFNGTDKAAALAAAVATPLAGVAAGYKIARGVTTITAASQDVVTGLATVVAACVAMQGDPTLTHLSSTVTIGDQAGTPAAGSITIKSWKPTASGNVTPIAATTPWVPVNWIAIGT